MNHTFKWVDEPQAGARWLELFARTWPAYRAWFLSEGDEARPDIETCRAELTRYMPEIVGQWEELTSLAGGDEIVARMLSLVDPPPYFTGCSQAVRSKPHPMLVRNYDFRLDSCEGVFLKSQWHGHDVLASSDCLWGALDGVNRHGLSVALAFGGSRKVGPGFGIPLILRYVLEVCETVDEATAILRRIPSHMAYNVALVDESGDYALAYLAPDRPPEVVHERVSTNHQRTIEWVEHAELTESARRKQFLEDQIDRRQSADRFVGRFLEPPLYVDTFERGYGTLYTSVYRPGERSVDFLWPHMTVHQSLDDFQEAERMVQFGDAGEAAFVTGSTPPLPL